MRFAKVVAVGFVALVALACTSISIPSIPPIVIPSFSIPPIPSGLLPSTVPGTSIDPGSGMCRLLTTAEVGAVMGSTVSITESTSDSCTYTAASTFATINVRTETGDLTAARFLLGDTAKPITVGSLSGLSGTFVGGPLVYLQRGNDQLVLQGILIGSDDASVAKVVQLATVAASRW